MQSHATTTSFCSLIFVVMCLGILHSASSIESIDHRLHHSRQKRQIEWGPDVAGPYCETRPNGCCPNRIDDCSVPILDTRCYCDEFCNRTRGDCCPDYFSYCLGVRPRPEPVRGACELNGRPYPPGSSANINCNTCRCSPDSRSATGHSWRCDGQVCLIRESLIQTVNGQSSQGWRASNYSQFWGMTLDDGIRKRLGTHKPDDLVMNMNPINVHNNGRLPTSFDARQKWPGWVHEVRDQGDCASSWAFSTTAIAADRLTIESQGAAPSVLSPQNLMACNMYGQDGCNGGNLDRAWWYIRKRGVTTEDCYPYTSGGNGIVRRCAISSRQTGGRCPSGIPFSVEKVFHATPPYRISPSEKDIMSEIEMNGPVQATFKVKDDFFMYRSGVYRYSRVDNIRPDLDEKFLYHSIRIIGWGEEVIDRRPVKYWLCANSWGTNWGENGYFRIQRGSNECDIEMFVLGAWGKVEGDEELRRLLQNFRAERQRERFLELDARRRNRRHSRRNRKHHSK